MLAIDNHVLLVSAQFFMSCDDGAVNVQPMLGELLVGQVVVLLQSPQRTIMFPPFCGKATPGGLLTVGSRADGSASTARVSYIMKTL